MRDPVYAIKPHELICKHVQAMGPVHLIPTPSRPSTLWPPSAPFCNARGDFQGTPPPWSPACRKRPCPRWGPSQRSWARCSRSRRRRWRVDRSDPCDDRRRRALHDGLTDRLSYTKRNPPITHPKTSEPLELAGPPCTASVCVVKTFRPSKKGGVVSRTFPAVKAGGRRASWVASSRKVDVPWPKHHIPGSKQCLIIVL